MTQEQIKDVKETLRILKEGHYNFGRNIYLTLEDFGKVLVYLSEKKQ